MGPDGIRHPPPVIRITLIIDQGMTRSREKPPSKGAQVPRPRRGRCRHAKKKALATSRKARGSQCRAGMGRINRSADCEQIFVALQPRWPRRQIAASGRAARVRQPPGRTTGRPTGCGSPVPSPWSSRIAASLSVHSMVITLVSPAGFQQFGVCEHGPFRSLPRPTPTVCNCSFGTCGKQRFRSGCAPASFGCPLAQGILKTGLKSHVAPCPVRSQDLDIRH